jgi:hypothetical protein
MIALALCALLGAPPSALALGPVTLELHTGTTGQLFYLVDQLAAWNEFAHPGYRRALGPLSAAEERLLGEHAALRRSRGYGVLDEVLLSDEPFTEALGRAAAKGRLSAAEAAVERRVLDGLSPRLRPFLARGEPGLAAARARLDEARPELAALVTKAARLCAVPTLRVPVFLVPSAEGRTGGGGASAGIVIVEVGAAGDPSPVLAHELFHALLRTHQAEVAKAAARTPGLDPTLLGEGLAYALSPGILHEGSVDALAAQVRADLDEPGGADGPYPRFHRFGLALRPLLRAALDDPTVTLPALLARAGDVFSAVEALSAAWTAPRRPALILLGHPAPDLVQRARRRPTDVWQRPHTAHGYAEALSHAHAGDAVVLLVTRADVPGGIPEAFRDLLPVPWAQVADELAAGRDLVQSATRRGLLVVLLGGADEAHLDALARRTGPLDVWMR